MPKTFLTKIKTLWQTKIKKSINIKEAKFGALLPVLLVALGVISLGAIKNTTLPSKSLGSSINLEPLTDTKETNQLATLASISDTNLSSLPIGDIKKYEVPGARGTAILIPQVHRNPGSEIQDQSNNQAVVAQGQIYDIEKYLNSHYGVDLFVVEGELNGPVPASKLEPVAAKLKIRNSLENRINSLKQSSGNYLDQSLGQKLIAELEQIVKNIDREIILQGAAYKLEAENNDLKMYGSEVKSTLDEGAQIVRNYIYLNDRIQVLQGQTSATQASASTQMSNPNLLKLLQMLSTSKGNSVSNDLNNLKSEAQNNNDGQLSSLLDSINGDLSQLDAINTSSAQTAASVPSRADNPYSNVTDVSVLKGKLSDAEAQIQTVIIDQRNKEAAQSFADSLSESREKAGVIQFGAGHEQGLVSELNKQGISVVVITPEEVLSPAK